MILIRTLFSISIATALVTCGALFGEEAPKKVDDHFVGPPAPARTAVAPSCPSPNATVIPDGKPVADEISDKTGKIATTPLTVGVVKQYIKLDPSLLKKLSAPAMERITDAVLGLPFTGDSSLQMSTVSKRRAFKGLPTKNAELHADIMSRLAQMFKEMTPKEQIAFIEVLSPTEQRTLLKILSEDLDPFAEIGKEHSYSGPYSFEKKVDYGSATQSEGEGAGAPTREERRAEYMREAGFLTEPQIKDVLRQIREGRPANRKTIERLLGDEPVPAATAKPAAPAPAPEAAKPVDAPKSE